MPTTSIIMPFKNSLLWSVSLICLLSFKPLNAQEIEFVPVGVFNFSYEYVQTLAESYMAAGMEKETMLNVFLDRSHLNEDDVSGSIKNQTTRQFLRMKYGLLDSLNLMLVVPYIDTRRESSLLASDAGDTLQNSFVENNKSVENQGMGDISLWCIWRLSYTDETDLMLGFGLDGDNAPYIYDDPDKLSLGSGAQEFTTYIRWLAYPRSVDMTVETEAGVILTRNSSVSSSDNADLTLKRGNSHYLHILLSFNFDVVNWGGRIRMNTIGETDIDGIGQGDAYLSYTGKLFLNLGNLHRLEQETLALPWMVGLYSERVLFGANAPDDQVSGITASIYF
jgi:hypothetical protein